MGKGFINPPPFLFDDLPTSPPAQWLTKTNLMSVFGMAEMEAAAEVIIAFCAEQGSWQQLFELSDFPSDCVSGFLQLLAHGWLEPVSSFSKSRFKLAPKFIERIYEPRKYSNAHGGWKPRKRARHG